MVTRTLKTSTWSSTNKILLKKYTWHSNTSNHNLPDFLPIKTVCLCPNRSKLNLKLTLIFHPSVKPRLKLTTLLNFLQLLVTICFQIITLRYMVGLASKYFFLLPACQKFRIFFGEKPLFPYELNGRSLMAI